MTEQLLQFIWQFQHYNAAELSTTAGEPLEIIHPGTYNTNQGPDFLNAKIKCAGTLLAGNIEVHVLASEWAVHGHSNDKNYNNVILHVVFKEDKHPALHFPCLQLDGRISKILLSRYEQLMQNQKFISCEEHLTSINDIIWISWKQRLFIERLQEKASYILLSLKKQQFHWEDVFWQMLAKSFGGTINGDAFEAMAVSLPVNVLAKHRAQPLQLEALLTGQCGLLESEFMDCYPIMLQKEFRFLKKKYALCAVHIPVHFLRMRPAGFPGVRLSQLAALIHNSRHLFSIVKDAESVKDIKKMFLAAANDYWLYHYSFDEQSAFKKKAIGTQLQQHIILNTVLPMLFAYGRYNNAESYIAKAIAWAEELKGEQNNITTGFEKLGISNISAADSQALIQLKRKYCDEKRCLECAVGVKLLKVES